MPHVQGTRGRGRPRRVDRSKIVAAARTLDPATLTIQAVADELGVDRKTVHYHVTDREELLRLVAEDAFLAVTSIARIDRRASWQESLRAFASIVRDASVQAGAVTPHLHFDLRTDWAALAPAEAALSAMLDAGIDADTAAKALRAVAVLAVGFARELVAESTIGADTQRTTLQAALTSVDDSLDALRILVESDVDTDTAAAMDFAIDLVIRGTESMLAARS